MPLPIGARLGVYEIVGALGAGGMGEVYRAHDTKLNRDIALKVLPPSVAADPERIARFHREAQVLAALNHPNIAHLYDMTSGVVVDPTASGGGRGSLNPGPEIHGLIMELVEGPTLAEKLAGEGPASLERALPVPEALAIARQLADALEAAHERGIIHRDLKPANIKVRDDGTVKVLDFGLAKALDADASKDPSSPPAMNSPTLTARSTQLGMILGTAAYMAPEQAKGRPVDKRADIWAFGAVLYEMLTGRRAFAGEDISDTLASVLRQDVDWSALPADTPLGARRLLARCLDRDLKRRLRDIGDAWADLDTSNTASNAVPASTFGVAAHDLPARSRAVSRTLPWAIAILAVAGSVAWMLVGRAPVAPRETVTRTMTRLQDLEIFVGLSHDGTRLAYSVIGGPGTASIGLRMMDQFDGKPLAGADNGAWPILSPDGQWVAYQTVFSVSQPSKIEKIPVTGGAPIELCDGVLAVGGDWGSDDTIVFVTSKGLKRIPAAGGTPETLTTIDTAKGETAHTRPQFLPGGRELLFTLTSNAKGDEFAVLDLASKTYRTVAPGGENGRFVTAGFLTYVRGSTLFAVPFDRSRLQVTGAPVPVVDDVSTQGSDGLADYTVSDAGLLVYVVAEAQGTALAWVDRSGATRILPGQARAQWGSGRLSPDGLRIANSIRGADGADVWVLDVDRGTPARLTFGGWNQTPIWTPDGRALVFSGLQQDKFSLSTVPADGSGKATVILETDTRATPTSISRDGHALFYTQAGPDKRVRIMTVPLSVSGAAGVPRPWHDAAAAEGAAEVSPDGKWVAYESSESGNPEVYVQAASGTGGRVRVSSQGGASPRWSRDAREVFFWAARPTSRLAAVGVATDAASETFRPGEPRELFQKLSGTTWDTTPDRNRFLMELTSSTGGSTIATVTNWFEDLRKRVAPGK
jgi:serine/threonine protein kinase/Tol biopolymer transport system component